MTLTEKIKNINLGMALQKRVACGNCGYYETFKKMLASEKRIYCGTEDNVEFFKNIISTLGLSEYIEYTVEDVNEELEIVIGASI